jgi:hypothetical protein
MSTVADARCECGFARRYTSEAKAAYALRRHSCERHRRLVEAAASALIDEAWADRTPKPCRHKVADHTHGTYACFVLDACRCVPCSVANSAYEADRRRRHAYGTFEDDWVDPEPVRQHVRALQAAGLGWKRIAAAAGVHQSTSWKLMYGKRRPDGTRVPTRRMRADLAAALLAVPTPTIDDLGSTVVIDPTGTRRRLEALAAIGWSVAALADRGHLDRQPLDAALRHQPVHARTARAVRDLYAELWASPRPAPDHRARGAVARARNRAATRGYVPPLGWDEDDLDDPYATPADGYDPARTDQCTVMGCPAPRFVKGLCATHYQAERRGGTIRTPVDLDEWCNLVAAGESPHRAARRCGTSLDYITHRAEQAGHQRTARLLRELDLASAS